MKGERTLVVEAEGTIETTEITEGTEIISTSRDVAGLAREALIRPGWIHWRGDVSSPCDAKAALKVAKPSPASSENERARGFASVYFFEEAGDGFATVCSHIGGGESAPTFPPADTFLRTWLRPPALQPPSIPPREVANLAYFNIAHPSSPAA